MKIFNCLLTALFVLNLVHVKAQCSATGSHYTTTAAGWSPIVDLADGVGTPSTSCGDGKNGTIFFWGTAAFFITARDGRELRLSKSISPLSDQNWTMDFMLNITPSQHGGGLENNSPSVTLASLTTNQMNLQSGCNGGNICSPCGSYPNTNMDAIWVDLTSDAPSGCNENQSGKNWRIVAYARDGSGVPISSIPINVPSGVNASYYIRVQRTNHFMGIISVYSNSDYTGHLPGSPQCFNIPGSVTGLDCLNHEVHSKESCNRVFNGNVDRMKIDNNVPCPTALYPSFTAPTSVCKGALFTVNGSASTSGTSIPISSHMWAVEECDANGNQFGPVWYGGSILGAPSGNYTINPFAVAANVNMQAGHYYKVSLVLQNCGNHWAPTSRVIYVNALPNIDMSLSSTVALSNNLVNLQPVVTGGPAPHTVHINIGQYWPGPSNVFAGNMPAQFTATQYTGTTYLLTAFNSAGCKSQRSWYVGMPNSFRPNFTLNTIPLNADEFTIQTIPEDVDGYNYEGFEYTHIIEELDPDDNAHYTSTSPDCWVSYPDFESFKGFISTGTGTYTQTSNPECGDPGRFLVGHTYRITTVMRALDMDEQQYSVIIYFEKSGNLVVKEDKKAPNMSHMLKQSAANNISILPNPSTGLFTIELEEEATAGSLIEITNALGQKVKSFEPKGQRLELDMTGFTKGIYVVMIVSKGSTHTKKIILE